MVVWIGIFYKERHGFGLLNVKDFYQQKKCWKLYSIEYLSQGLAFLLQSDL